MEEQVFLWNKYIKDIIDEYADTVYKSAFALTGNKMDTVDVFMRVFIKFIKRMPVFYNKEQEKEWFIRNTVSCLRNLWKFISHKNNKAEVYDFNRNSKLEENLSEKNLFEEYLRLIPRKYSIVIHLYYYEKMSVSQIGKILNRKEEIIQLQLERLRSLFDEYMSGDNVDFEKNYQLVIIKMKPDVLLKDRMKDRMYQEFKSKYSYLSKMKYRSGILFGYLLFALLSALIFNIQNERYYEYNTGKETTVLQENGNYFTDGYEYKKGDLVWTEFLIPDKFQNEEIKVLYYDYSSGKSSEIYNGNPSEKIKITFTVKEDGIGYFQIFSDKEENNITDSVSINCIINRYVNVNDNSNMTPIK